jgi:hypothetical protein
VRTLKADATGSTRRHDTLEMRAMLLQHGVALSVILDLLVEQGITSREEIAARAERIRTELGLVARTPAR